MTDTHSAAKHPGEIGPDDVCADCGLAGFLDPVTCSIASKAARAAEARGLERAAQEVRAIEAEVEDGETVVNLCDELERRIRALASGNAAPAAPDSPSDAGQGKQEGAQAVERRGVRLKRSKEWWLAKARAEGDSAIGAGLAWIEGQPGHVCTDGLFRPYSEYACSAPHAQEQPPLAAPDAGALLAEPWRRLLWLRHGCSTTSLYGDDGEMQCAACLLDFKRMSAAAVEARWKLIGDLRMRCDADCTTGPEGGVLHSVTHQYRLAGGGIKTCPVCGEERHAGTCVDAVSAPPCAAAPAPPPVLSVDPAADARIEQLRASQAPEAVRPILSVDLVGLLREARDGLRHIDFVLGEEKYGGKYVPSYIKQRLAPLDAALASLDR